MSASTAQNLVSGARSAASKLLSNFSAKKKLPSTSVKKKSPSTSVKKKKPSSEVADLKTSVSAISSSSEATINLLKHFKSPPSSSVHSLPPASPTLSGIVSDGLNPGSRIADDSAAEELSTDASEQLSMAEWEPDWEDEYEDGPVEVVVDMPWSMVSNCGVSPQRQEGLKGRKQRWSYKSSQTSNYDKLVSMCGKKLGSGATIELFGKMKRDSGLKEYTALIHGCIQKARACKDEDAVLEIYTIHEIFRVARENGFKYQEDMYRNFLLYLIEFGMVQEFLFFHKLITDENPDSLTRLAYYEMLLWVRVGNEVKIEELCRDAIADGSQDKSHVRENLLMALCESDRKEELLMLLQVLDITNITSISFLRAIFRCLGKFSLETFAEQFVQALKNSGTYIGAVDISNFICEYAIHIPNISVEDTIIKFKTLHVRLEMLPTSAQYKKLIKYACELQKVHEALKIVDEAFDSGVPLSLEIYHSILVACIKSCELNLVHQVNAILSRHKLEPDTETFRLMILLYVKMKDFEGAYGMISDLVKMKLKPSAEIYNILLSGLLHEKNIFGARNVLKAMEAAGVEPDARTFSHLILHSTSEKDITEFYEQMTSAGVPLSKKVFMSLIHAYATCGQFEKATEVVLDKRIPVKNLNEVKSALIGSLASKGQFSSAFKLYEDMKKVECSVDPKAIRTLIQHVGPEGDFDKILQLLEEINYSPHWIDGCFKVISYCLKQENLSSALDLIKQLVEKDTCTKVDTDVIFDEVFCQLAEKTDMQFGLSLLKAVKEELGVTPSRKTLDFLLSGCVNAKDAKASFVIWKEYELAGLPYNVLSYLRMYQALLASGDGESAAKILAEIPTADIHVNYVVNACARTYALQQQKEEVEMMFAPYRPLAPYCPSSHQSGKKKKKQKWRS